MFMFEFWFDENKYLESSKLNFYYIDRLYYYVISKRK